MSDVVYRARLVDATIERPAAAAVTGIAPATTTTTTVTGHLPVGRTGGYDAWRYCCSHSRGATSLRVL